MHFNFYILYQSSHVVEQRKYGTQKVYTVLAHLKKTVTNIALEHQGPQYVIMNMHHLKSRDDGASNVMALLEAYGTEGRTPLHCGTVRGY